MRRNLREAALAVAAALSSLGTLVALHGPAEAVVLAVILAFTLSRIERPADGRDRLLHLVLLPVYALATSLFAVLWTPVADAAFCLAVAATIWVRRFGPRWSGVGKLATAPLVATLVLPAHDPLWSVTAAVTALVWVYATSLLAKRPPAPAAPRSTVSTRMAVQMGVALAVAFVLGRVVFGDHWAWVVLTAFIVCSGNRGRGDVVYKSLLRVGGALGGTLAATGLLLVFGQYKGIDVVVIFVVLAVAAWLRPVNYAWWAGGVTAALAFLYAVMGQGGTELLAVRLVAIAIGGVIGVAASWLILPVRTTAVVRGRIRGVLKALADLLAALDGSGDLTPYRRKFDAALDNLDQVSPPLIAHRRLVGRGKPHWADLIDMLRRCAPPVHAVVDRAPATGDAAEILKQAKEDLATLATDPNPAAIPALDRRIGRLAAAMLPA